MMTISSDKVCYLVIKAREYHAKTEPVVSDPGDNPTDNADREIMFDLPDDPTEEEIRGFFSTLNEDEAIELAALLLIGSGAYAVEEWQEAVLAARADPDSRRAEAILSRPLAADYLEEGLTAFGFSCADVDMDRL